MYFANKPPENVPRREPTQRTTVARIEGQNDIPSSPPNVLAALRQATRGASASTSRMSTSNSEPRVETVTNEPARTEPASSGLASSASGQQSNDPFGQSNHSSFEPQHRPIAEVAPEDAHLLDIPDSESNPNFRDADNWNTGFGDRDVMDGYDEFNAGEGEFNYGGGGFDFDAGLNGVNYGGGGGNWTYNLQAPQSEFAMPQSSTLLNSRPGLPPTSLVPPNVSNFGQTSQTPSTGGYAVPSLPTSTSSAEQSHNQPPPTASPLLGHPQYAVLPPPAPHTNTLPANEPYFPSYTRAPATSIDPMATTLSNNNFDYEPVSTPMRTPTAALQARLRRLNDSSKKISSKTPQRKHMKANVAAHYASKRARRQRNRRGHHQTPQEAEPREAESPQGGSTSTAAPAAAPTSDELTSDQLAVMLPMRKYIGFHILTRTAWPMEQPALLASALAYARTVPGNSDVGDIEFDHEFSRQLKLKESSLRCEFISLIMQSVKDFHQISPSTRGRIDSLIKDDCFVYQDGTITPRSQPGFFGNRLIFEVTGAFLFQHPHLFGTLFIEELCSEDAPKKWHAKAADKSATNGAPVGLLAFAGVAILHCLECIRDRPPTGKKAYKFEHSRYNHVWTRYRKELIKYKHLGALRRKCLGYIK
ncbi:hypothetical protein FRC09_017055 [Ceratobasidium sp. 395]|nr:hypothetical protein FRC09_017055 [Ceratobasidium sp. 395]